ncbi:MAG: hypothetical protein AAGF49_04710 [Pseudomonadota bacterium]
MTLRNDLQCEDGDAEGNLTRRSILSRGAMLAAFMTVPVLAACNGAEDAAEDAADEAGDAARDAADAVGDAAEDAGDAVEDAADDAAN